MGFWIKHQDAFFDVRVFNPLAASNQNPNILTTFQRHEREKRRMYDQRIREIEHGLFTPLVFSDSACGGMRLLLGLQSTEPLMKQSQSRAIAERATIR